MAKTKRLVLGLLVTILCLALVVATVNTFDQTGTLNNNGLMASAASNGDVVLASEGDQVRQAPDHNVTWTHGDVDVQELKNTYTLSGGSEYAPVRYYLNGDITGNLTIESDSYVELCLNGYAIDAGGSGTVITINRGATFILDDCCKGETCETDGHSHQVGDATIYGGVITGGKDGYNGGGVYVHDGAFTMNGGTICGNTAEKGGGVFISYTDATFTMNFGEISGNTAEQGGGVYSDYAGFTMTGGTISGNTAEKGGGLCIDGTLINIGGGKITDNEATECGGGVYVSSYETQFCMSGGEITDNEAPSGGGMYVCGALAFSMTGGKIFGNTATTGGGVFVVGGTFGVGGAPVITDNAGSNVYLVSGFTITIVDALEADADVGVTLEDCEGVFTTKYNQYNSGDDPSNYFFADDSLYAVTMQDGEVALIEHDHVWTWTMNDADRGNATTPRTQTGVCSVCSETTSRTLVLDRVEASADSEYATKDTELKNLTVTAYFIADDGSEEEIEFVLSSGEYSISAFANGKYLTAEDEQITISYTIGRVTKTATISITVKPAFDWLWLIILVCAVVLVAVVSIIVVLKKRTKNNQ